MLTRPSSIPRSLLGCAETVRTDFQTVQPSEKNRTLTIEQKASIIIPEIKASSWPKAGERNQYHEKQHHSSVLPAPAHWV